MSVFHSAVPVPPTDVRIEVVIGTTSTSIIVSWTVSGAYTQFICILLERTLCILGLTYILYTRKNALLARYTQCIPPSVVEQVQNYAR